jgi:hypothetical protein
VVLVLLVWKENPRPRPRRAPGAGQYPPFVRLGRFGA